MQIITIYQGASGSGEELADAVAQALGYRSVSTAKCWSKPVCSTAFPKPNSPRSSNANRVGGRPSRAISIPYRIALQAAFCEIARDHGIVYHGHLGHELIPKFRTCSKCC